MIAFYKQQKNKNYQIHINNQIKKKSVFHELFRNVQHTHRTDRINST